MYIIKLSIKFMIFAMRKNTDQNYFIIDFVIRLFSMYNIFHEKLSFFGKNLNTLKAYHLFSIHSKSKILNRFESKCKVSV
jgi:hypothetical protein